MWYSPPKHHNKCQQLLDNQLVGQHSKTLADSKMFIAIKTNGPVYSESCVTRVPGTQEWKAFIELAKKHKHLILLLDWMKLNVLSYATDILHFEK